MLFLIGPNKMMMMRQIRFLILISVLFFAGCASMKSPLLEKYESELAMIDQRAARGEITQTEADNLKLQAQQAYLDARRCEEKSVNDDIERKMQSQNQEVNAVLAQVRQENT